MTVFLKFAHKLFLELLSHQQDIDQLHFNIDYDLVQYRTWAAIFWVLYGVQTYPDTLAEARRQRELKQ